MTPQNFIIFLCCGDIDHTRSVARLVSGQKPPGQKPPGQKPPGQKTPRENL